MKQCMDADNLHRRLKKIIGQVQAIDRMVDQDVPCEDILSQINSAKSAVVLAITGILNPVVGALVHNAGSVLVIVNSAFLLGWKKRKKKQ